MMSYFQMDHAGWVEGQLPQFRKRAKDKSHTLPLTLSPFQRRVFNIMGIAANGIHNAPIAWDGIRWNYGRPGLAVPWRGSLETWDFDGLTKLVLLCHTARIRCEVMQYSPEHLLLCFWERSHTGGMTRRHPSTLEALDGLEAALPVDSNIRYQMPEPELGYWWSHVGDDQCDGPYKTVAEAKIQAYYAGAQDVVIGLMRPVGIKTDLDWSEAFMTAQDDDADFDGDAVERISDGAWQDLDRLMTMMLEHWVQKHAITGAFRGLEWVGQPVRVPRCDLVLEAWHPALHLEYAPNPLD